MISEKILEIAKCYMKNNAKSSYTYLEAGANNGIAQSNTLMLEQMGWSGILVEPSRAAFEELLHNRPNNILVNAALGSGKENGFVVGNFGRGSLMGSLRDDLNRRDALNNKVGFSARLKRRFGLKSGYSMKMERIECKTIDSIVKECNANDIDLLSLDIEGYEHEALLGMESLRPSLIVVESRADQIFWISDYLLKCGYVMTRCVSGFSMVTDKEWSGDHQDYLWVHMSVRGDLRDYQ